MANWFVDVRRFCAAVLFRWQGYITGGFLAACAFVYEHLTGQMIPGNVVFVGVVGFFFAGAFSAWREHARAIATLTRKTHILTIRPGLLMTATGPVNAEGKITILWSIGNDSKPQAEIHNVKAEFWCNETYLVRQATPAGTTIRAGSGYQLELPLLHKNDGGMFLKWEFKVPPIGEKIRFGHSAVASETDWQTSSWTIVNDGTDVRLEKYPPTTAQLD